MARCGIIEVVGARVTPKGAQLLGRPEQLVPCEALDTGGLRITLEGGAPDRGGAVARQPLEDLAGAEEAAEIDDTAEAPTAVWEIGSAECRETV